MEWQVGSGHRVLNLGANPRIVSSLLEADNSVVSVTDDMAALDKLTTRLNLQASEGRLVGMVGAITSLPVAPQSCDVVLVNRALRPGIDLKQAFVEIASSLTDDGWVTGSSLERDDTVPWVFRLTQILRSVDANAMTGDFTDHRHEALIKSKYFPHHERHDFRIWVPAAQSDLIEMVSAQPQVAELDESQRRNLLAQVHDLSNERQLRLPYVLHCWRAYVNQNELTRPIRLDSGAIRFRLLGH